MVNQQDMAWRAEMLRLRGFYASRAALGGNLVIREVQPGRSITGGYVRRVIESIGGIDVSTQSNEQLFHLLTEESQASSSPNAGENTLPMYRALTFRRIVVSPATRAAHAASHATDRGREINAASHATDRGREINAASHATDRGRQLNAASHATDRGRELNAASHATDGARVLNAASHARSLEEQLNEEKRSKGYENNFVLPTNKCNPYYQNSKFVKSNEENDWFNAIKSDKYFGFRRVKGYESLQLFWNRSCPNCGCRFLNTQSDSFLTKCCRTSQEVSYPPELPVTPGILKAIKDDPVEMSTNATTTNNILAFGATCVDNNTGGGFQKDFRGNHSVTIKGKTYHKTHQQQKSNPTSGLGVMFFEHSQTTARDLARAENNRRRTGV